MFQQTRLKLEFWAAALHTVVYLINLSLSKAIWLEVPEARWSGKHLTYDRLRTFGCKIDAFIPRDTRTKLASHATKCIFRSYGTDGEFRYRLWDPQNRELIRSSDVVFNEDSILSKRSQLKIIKKNHIESFRERIGWRRADIQSESAIRKNTEAESTNGSTSTSNWLNDWPKPNWQKWPQADPNNPRHQQHGQSLPRKRWIQH